MDEETQAQTQNEGGAEVSAQVESSPAQDQTSESPQAEAQPAPSEEQGGEAERKPNRAERRNAERENRIRELTGQVKQMEQESQLSQGWNQPQVPVLQPGQEIDPAQYQAHVVQAAQSIANLTVQQQIAQERAVNSLERDTEVLPSRYVELNPDSPDYSPELEKAITEEFQEKAFRVTGYDPRTGKPMQVLDPSVRLADIAKRYTDVARSIAKKSQAGMANAVAQSADTGAIRPQGQAKADRKFEDLSIQEMEAKLGYVKRR